MAVLPKGSLLISDWGNGIIRKLGTDGRLSAWLGRRGGSMEDGLRAKATTYRFHRLVVDRESNLFLGNTANSGGTVNKSDVLIRRIDKQTDRVTTWVY